MGLVFIAVSGISCTAYFAARQEKKDQKHVGYIMARPPLIDQITKVGNALHPVNLSPVIIQGKDSIVYAKPDERALNNANRVIDSLLGIKCQVGTGVDRDSLISAIRNELKKTIEPITVYKTTTVTIKDTSCIHQYQLLQADNFKKEGQIIQLKSDNSELKKSVSTKTWWMAGISAIFFLAIGILVFLLIKKL